MSAERPLGEHREEAVAAERSTDAGDRCDEIQATRFSTDVGGKADSAVDAADEHLHKSDESTSVIPEFRGQPVDNDVDSEIEAEPGTDIVRSALAGARQTSRTRGRARNAESRRRTRRENLAGRNQSGYSGPGRDPARDPQPIGPMLADYVTDLGWERPLAEGRVFADWSGLVGPDVAAHCIPQTLRDGELRITAESTAWATQLRLLASTLLARLVAELGPEVVTRLVITGPVGPSWKHGGRSVRGARGPRDTYG